MLKYVRLLSFSFTNKWQLTELAENTCKPFFKNYYSISIFLFSCEIQPCWYLRLRFPLNSWWFVIMSACLGICLSPWIKQCIIYKFHGESGMSFFFFFCLQIHVSFSGKFPYNRFVCVCNLSCISFIRKNLDHIGSLLIVLHTILFCICFIYSIFHCFMHDFSLSLNIINLILNSINSTFWNR